MRLKTSLFWTFLLIVALQFQSTAAICWFFCDSTSSDSATSASPSGSGTASSGTSNSISATASSSQSSSSSAVPSSSSSIISSTSSPTPTPTSSSVQPTSTSSTLTSTQASTSSAAPSATETPEQKDKGSNNTGAIVGGVCGFVALIAAGFAYAFFSKTKRNKRKQYENQDIFNDAAYQSDPFNKSRPSPAMGAALVQGNVSPQMQHNTQWDQQNYNNYGYTMSPQPPAAAMMNDAYYAAPPMNYNDPYYNQQQQPSYYDMGYQQPMYDQQHYQTPGMGVATLPPQTPALSQNNMAAPITNSNVYSAPHAYDDTGAPNSHVNQPPPPPLKH